MATQEPKTVAFVLYPGITLLDMVGPLQVFSVLQGFNDQYRPVVVAERIEPMPTDTPSRSSRTRPSTRYPTRPWCSSPVAAPRPSRPWAIR